MSPLRTRAPRAPRRPILAVALVGLLVSACGDGDSPPAPSPPPARPSPSRGPGESLPWSPPTSAARPGTPGYQITMILLVYKSPRHPQATRTREEARALALSLVRRIRDGESMERLLLAHTDDRDEAGKPFNDGTYSLLSEGDPADPRIVDLAARTPVGEVAADLFDSGQAFVVLRRDA